MRINKQIFLPLLFVSALPTTSVLLGDGNPKVDGDVDAQADGRQVSSVTSAAEVAEVASGSWASVLSPAYIFQGIQNTYLPSAFRTTGAIQPFTEPEPSPSDFWDEANKNAEDLQAYVHTLLEAAGAYFGSTKFADITIAMNHIIGATATFRDNIEGALDAHNITLDVFTGELEGIFMSIVKDLEKTPPPNKAPSCAELMVMVDRVLDDIAQALEALAMRYGIKEEVITAYLLALRLHVRRLILAVCELNEQCPQLLPVLLFCIATLLIPESWILRSLLSIFGFGPAGPVKGSFAAWAQRYFWGATVKAGSWFAWLQAAGMGVFPKWAGFALKAPLLIGDIFMMISCFIRR